MIQWPKLKPHRLQSQAWFTDRKFVILACGRGSGKTELARRKAIRSLAVTHDLPLAYHGYALPTYSQARRVAWDALKSLVPKEWIVGEPRDGDMTIDTIFRSRLVVAGLDKPQRIEGTQWSSFFVDESCDVKPGTFDKSILPALTHFCHTCWRIGVPKSQGIGSAEFRQAFEIGASDPDTYAASWPTSDIVSPAELEHAKRTLSKADYDEQYDAKWQNLGGDIFHAYNEAKNVSSLSEYRPNQPIIVMSDFNVDPMCWCFGHFIDGRLYVFDEFSLEQTNTPASLDVLYSRYGNHEAGWLFTGDAAARANKTSADMSDYIHIYNDTRFKNKRVVYATSNPSVQTRFASCNAAFCNALDECRVFIHPRCGVLRADLKNRHYKKGTREPNDSKRLGHMSDAFGYGVMLLMPITPNHNVKPKVYTA
jgi:hypothetical protein